MGTDSTKSDLGSTATPTQVCTRVDLWATVRLVSFDDDLPVHRLTVNQLVAYNVSNYRRHANMTQEHLAELLTFFSGKPWSKATVSAAERSLDGTRVRQFDADDLLSLSQALGVPVPGFFLPPDDDGEAVKYEVAPAGSERTLGMEGLLEALVVSLENIEDDERGALHFSERMQTALETYFGTSAYHDLTGVFDLNKLAGVSLFDDPEERQDKAALALDQELTQAIRLLRRLLDSLHRGQAAVLADEESQS